MIVSLLSTLCNVTIMNRELLSLDFEARFWNKVPVSLVQNPFRKLFKLFCSACIISERFICYILPCWKLIRARDVCPLRTEHFTLRIFLLSEISSCISNSVDTSNNYRLEKCVPCFFFRFITGICVLFGGPTTTDMVITWYFWNS